MAVREMATEIRGDVSRDIPDLSQMPEVSVDVAGEAPDYGVKASDTFWCRQGILRRSQLRDSEDEQMIADLAISALEGKPFAFSGSSLDEYYTVGTDQFKSIEKNLAAYGATRLKSDVMGTLSVLRETIDAVDGSANAFRKIVHPEAGGNPVKTAFFAVFFAFYELCVKQKKSPGNNAKIMKALSGLQNLLDVAAGQIRTEPRQKNIDVVCGLIQKHFVDKQPPALDHGAGATLAFENAIRRSRTETAAYECKQGVLRLDDSRSEDKSVLSRIVETLCGIANIGPNEEGAIFIGVADKKADRDRIVGLDRVSPAEISSRYVVGVDRECAILKTNIDKYKRKVVDYIAGSKLSDPLKSGVLAKIDCVVYRGCSVICLWVPPQRSYSTVDDVIFTREGASTKEVKGAKQSKAVFERFE